MHPSDLTPATLLPLQSNCLGKRNLENPAETMAIPGCRTQAWQKNEIFDQILNIKIKLTLDCCTDKGKNAGNWVGTGNTSCPSWMGGWTDRWTDRYCTTYSHNWIQENP